MEFRYPDNPVRISRDALKELDAEGPGVWALAPKMDGWRREVCFHEDNRVTFHAKHNTGEEAARNAPEDLVNELKGLSWPKGLVLDIEWMGTRLKDLYKGEHAFHILDVLAVEGTFLEKVNPFERHKMLRDICLLVSKGGSEPKDPLSSELDLTERIHLTPMKDRNLWSHFVEQEKNNPKAEGVVVRHVASGLILDRWAAKENKLWHKVKWRDIKEKTAF